MECALAAGLSPGNSDDTKSYPLDDLDGEHHHLLVRAISRVLSTDIAEITYAQIVDGLPLADVARQTNFHNLHYQHPVLSHTHLCPGSLEKTKEFRTSFHPGILQLKAPLFYAYRAAPPGSKEFRSRLFEIIAVSIHQIAVQLFDLGTSQHQNDSIAEWTPPKPNGDIEQLWTNSDDTSTELFWWHNHPDGAYPTLFFHSWYIDYKQYPNGVADMVGYWAEACILGGMMQFDRRHDGDVQSVFLHPDRTDVSYRIYGLLPEQKQLLWEFLTAETPPALSPLPFLSTKDNRHRFDPEDSSEASGIYRDIWERLELPSDHADQRLRDVYSRFDYPGPRDRPTDDFIQSRQRAEDRKERIDRMRMAEDLARLEDNSGGLDDVES